MTSEISRVASFILVTVSTWKHLNIAHACSGHYGEMNWDHTKSLF